MARPKGMATRKPIRGNLKPPKGAVLTGELLPDGRPVYRRKKWRKADVRPMTDTAGRPVYKKSMPGLAPEQRMEAVLEPYEVEFVLDDAGNGMTFENYRFRPTAYELEQERRREMERRGQEQLGELATALAAADLTIPDLIRSIRGEKAEKPADPMAKARAARAAKLAAQREAEKNGGNS